MKEIIENRIIPIVLALAILIFMIGVAMASNVPVLAKIILDLTLLVLLYVPYNMWHFDDY